jgi:hypothetical protein
VLSGSFVVTKEDGLLENTMLGSTRHLCRPVESGDVEHEPPYAKYLQCLG